MRQLSVLLIVVLIAIFLLIYLNFGSPKSALLIVLVLPLAFVGGVVAAYLFDGVLSVSSTVGFIALFGIALSNGIVLITHINDLRKEGMGLREAILQGGRTG